MRVLKAAWSKVRGLVGQRTIQITISEKVYARIAEVCERDGITTTEFVVRAFAIMDAEITKRHEEDTRLLFGYPDGSVRKVVFTHEGAEVRA